MDDRALFRYRPGYARVPVATALDWSDRGGFLAAVEMCNNNGACRKADAGVMCPSYLATRDEKDLTRGRANSLRLALSGQLGPGALFSDDMKDVMDLCVSCKGCRRGVPDRRRHGAHEDRVPPPVAQAPRRPRLARS